MTTSAQHSEGERGDAAAASTVQKRSRLRDRAARRRTSATAVTPAAGTASEPRPPRQQTRRGVLAAGVALIAVGILGGAWWGTQVGGEPARVLVLTHDLPAGEPLTRQVLRAEDLTAGDGLSAIPVSEVDSYLGLVPTGNLPSGTMLIPAMFAPSTVIAEGQALVGVVATLGQVPVTGLRPGDRVSLVAEAQGSGNVSPVAPGGDSGAQPTGEPAEAADRFEGRIWEGRVARVSGDLLVDGTLLVDVEVAQALAPELAAAASANLISIVLHPTTEVDGTAPDGAGG